MWNSILWNSDFDFLTSKKLFCCERVELDDEDLVENHNGFGSTSGATGGKKKSVKENIGEHTLT